MKANKTTRIPEDELRARYDALPPLPESPGERRWFDRLRSFEDFLAFGPASASLLGTDADPNASPWLRPAAPELFDLLMEAFG